MCWSIIYPLQNVRGDAPELRCRLDMSDASRVQPQ
jgi:hypothetical protein